MAYAVAATVAASAALLSPLTSAIPAEDAWPLRLAVAAIGTFICLAVAVSRGVRPAIWTSLAIGAAALGVALLLLHLDARTQCLAEYDGRVVVIGREYLPEMTTYVANNPGLSAADRLFDAGGVPERIWTPASIRTCTRLVGISGLAAIPCITLAAAALVSRHRHRFLPSPLAPASAAQCDTTRARPCRQSVRRVSQLPTFRAGQSVRPGGARVLENRRLRVAVDFRDFAANEHFLSEMERCIK